MMHEAMQRHVKVSRTEPRAFGGKLAPGERRECLAGGPQGATRMLCGGGGSEGGRHKLEFRRMPTAETGMGSRKGRGNQDKLTPAAEALRNDLL